MQPFRLGRWGSSILPLGSRHATPLQRCHQGYSIRLQTTAQSPVIIDGPGPKRSRIRAKKGDAPTCPPRPARPRASPSTPSATAAHSSAQSTTSPLPTSSPEQQSDDTPPAPSENADPQARNPKTKTSSPKPFPIAKLSTLPSPPPSNAKDSAKLAALHARIGLPSQMPYEALARCLVDHSADPDTRFSNHYLAALGNDILGYYIGEHLICHYPRLPMVVLEAAMLAHVGPKALESLGRSWGVEVAAEPGGEVDPGLLQFRRTYPSRRDAIIAKTMSEAAQEATGSFKPAQRTVEAASAYFIRAVVASIYLYGGREKVTEFVKSHLLSRRLDLHTLFSFREPARDLSRLCAREGFESPIARVISETGRLSRHPVYVVGIFSGRDKIGEDAGASLNEARFKAAAKALKGWYLYSPKTAVGGGEIMVPSMMEGEPGKTRTWRKPHIDEGEVIA